MAWVKRNLIFVICVAIAVGVAGFCGYLYFASLGDNSQAVENFQSKKSAYEALKGKTPALTKENIDAADQEADRVRSFLAEFHKPFAGFAVPPKMDDRTFHDYLQKMVFQFATEATNASVNFTPGYAFGYSQQMNTFNFDPNDIIGWSQQLEEIHAILRILYKSKINFLDSVKRPSVGTFDLGPDVINFITNATPWGTVSPYQITFRAFSSEIASVLQGFASSSNCFIVKGVYVTPTHMALANISDQDMSQPMQEVQEPSYNPRYEPGKGRFGRAPQPRPRPVTPTAPVVVAEARPVTILREVPLYVTLYVDVVKLKVAEPAAQKSATPGAAPTRPGRGAGR